MGVSNTVVSSTEDGESNISCDKVSLFGVEGSMFVCNGVDIACCVADGSEVPTGAPVIFEVLLPCGVPLPPTTLVTPDGFYALGTL